MCTALVQSGSFGPLGEWTVLKRPWHVHSSCRNGVMRALRDSLTGGCQIQSCVHLQLQVSLLSLFRLERVTLLLQATTTTTMDTTATTLVLQVCLQSSLEAIPNIGSASVRLGCLSMSGARCHDVCIGLTSVLPPLLVQGELQ